MYLSTLDMQRADNTTPSKGKGTSFFWGYFESLESLLRSQGQEVFPRKNGVHSARFGMEKGSGEEL